MQNISFLGRSTCLLCYNLLLLLKASIFGDIFGIFRHIRIDWNLHILDIQEKWRTRLKFLLFLLWFLCMKWCEIKSGLWCMFGYRTWAAVLFTIRIANTATERTNIMRSCRIQNNIIMSSQPSHISTIESLNSLSFVSNHNIWNQIRLANIQSIRTQNMANLTPIRSFDHFKFPIINNYRFSHFTFRTFASNWTKSIQNLWQLVTVHSPKWRQCVLALNTHDRRDWEKKKKKRTQINKNETKNRRLFQNSQFKLFLFLVTNEFEHTFFFSSRNNNNNNSHTSSIFGCPNRFELCLCEIRNFVRSWINKMKRNTCFFSFVYWFALFTSFAFYRLTSHLHFILIWICVLKSWPIEVRCMHSMVRHGGSHIYSICMRVRSTDRVPKSADTIHFPILPMAKSIIICNNDSALCAACGICGRNWFDRCSEQLQSQIMRLPLWQ